MKTGGIQTDMTQQARGMASLTQKAKSTWDLWFGPSLPITSVVPVQQAEESGARGRAFDFRTGQNLQYQPKSEEPSRPSFSALRGLADNYDLLRGILETAKDEVESTEWVIRPVDQKKKPEEDPRCKLYTDLLLFPDRVHSWKQWLRALLEDLFVVGSPVIYPRMTKGGGLYSLDLVDPATIKLVIDGSGRRPMPPDPAFQQILKGVPVSPFTADELIHHPRDFRSNHLYPFSPVEWVVMTVNIAIRRQLHQLEFYCYSDDTEVLTRRGWLRFAECVETDEFATREIGTGVFEWQKAYDTFYKHYTGKMIHFKGRSLDLLVTPSHRMVVTTKPKALGGNAGRKGECVITAEELMLHGTCNTAIPQTSTWNGKEIGPQSFEEGACNARNITMSGDDFCAFMGMYLAQGCTHKGKIISIAQPESARGSRAKYKEVLSRVFGSIDECSPVSLSVCSSKVVDYLKQFGLASDKFIPAIIRDATVRQIEIFFRYYYLGDGRAAGDDGVQTQSAFTVSRKLADQLTEIGQKMGYAPTVWTRAAGTALFKDKKAGTERTINCREGYMVSFARQKATNGWTPEVVDYDAPVACVCVPNKFLYVRRNGKACWSGNTEGTVPDAIIGCPKEWNPDQVRQFQDYWDSLLENNTAQRRHARFVPDGVNITMTKANVLKDDYDEWLARIICFFFSQSPTPFIKQMNRATAGSSAEQAKEQGSKVTARWLSDLMTNRVLRQCLNAPDLEFVFKAEEDIDPMVQAEIDKIYLQEYVISPDEVREKKGYEGPAPVKPLPPALGQPTVEPGDDQNGAVAKDNTGVPGAGTTKNLPKGGAQSKPAGGDTPVGTVAAKPAKTGKAGGVAGTAKGKAKAAVPKTPGKVEKSAQADVERASKKKSIAAIDRDRPAVKKLRKQLGDELNDFFLDALKGVAQQIADGVAVEDIDLKAFADLIEPVQAKMQSIYEQGGDAAFVQIGVAPAVEMTNLVNQKAVEYAQTRSAELVGMKNIGSKELPEWIENPNAEWSITESTREMIRSTVETATEEGWSNQRVAKALRESEGFSKDRAMMIARTETAFADSNGNMAAYRASGVVTGKEWILGSNHDLDDDCDENSEAGVIPLDEPFPSGDDCAPLHPG